MANQQIDYDALVQDALVGVVKNLLIRTAKTGLPGQHHFYIAFRTGYPGVVVPKHLKAKYPDEMTIVLQNQFWDLKVMDDRFEVGLSFNQKLETLVVPFAALSGFLDPSVEFGLQFQHKNVETGSEPSSMELEVDDGPSDVSSEPQNPAEKVVTLDAFRKKK